ncbi:5-methylcytosine restriction system specificity protein McrC [Secundilactobacillus folii]|uniref:Restriction endonuclease n=1 Tax=Secundilactobacillus folii TaxID=2678357 RepID=A0A7X3C2M5_9LACO|nr:restriction endonuclease [Secundilactobacillus folii]MTV81617.1 restriction endonuclease [Secundilactobacillus folii]
MGQENHVSVIEIPTFTDYIYHLPKKMRDSRNPLESHMKFVDLNRKVLTYLDIDTYFLSGDLHLVTNGYVGAIPIRMQKRNGGETSTDLIVKPRYGADESNWFAWMDGLAQFSGLSLSSETNPNYTLTRSEGTPTPKYILAQEVVKSMVNVLKEQSWISFENRETELNRPLGKVNWQRYAQQSADPQKQLLFPTKINLLTHNHSEFRRALNVLAECVAILNGQLTPIQIKQRTRENQAFLRRYVPISGFLKRETQHFKIRKNEGAFVTQLKRDLNRFIDLEVKQQYSWRIDFSTLFERYVQTLLQQSVTKLHQNPRVAHHLLPGYTRHVSRLMPKYLEPDMIAEFEGREIILDAKYKSYFYPRQNEGIEEQRKRIRNDVHQIIAYASLASTQISVIVAPIDGKEVVQEVSRYEQAIIGVVGLPLSYQDAKYYGQTIRKFLNSLIILADKAI